MSLTFTEHNTTFGEVYAPANITRDNVMFAKYIGLIFILSM